MSATAAAAAKTTTSKQQQQRRWQQRRRRRRNSNFRCVVHFLYFICNFNKNTTNLYTYYIHIQVNM